MAKISTQLEQQRFILKIHSTRLARNKWNLTLPIEEARNNDEVISLASSQVLRWIDEINGNSDCDFVAGEIKEEIKRIRKLPESVKTRRDIRVLYKDLDEIQFKRDYMCLIIDKNAHYKRACNGFKINGVKYRRLLATNGGVKSSTIIFVSENVYPELSKRIENGRDMTKKFVPCKLETYKALSCSASSPVSWPKGILVVKDVETTFKTDYVYMSDENDGDPIMELRKNESVTLDVTDGFGLMSPLLAARWSYELGLDYVMCGCNTRAPFEKGMVFAFDFIDFAEKVSGTYNVTDVWGNTHDIRNIELIFTESMLKLWDSYESCDEYVQKSKDNGYSIGIAKTCPKELENERDLNYQFIQSYDLDDHDIDDLISPTINQIRGVLNDDWRKAVLFLRGSYITDKSAIEGNADYSKAIMANSDVFNDTYVKSCIYRLIRNRIDEAKTGVIRVHGNYSIASGDPYLLCESIFGMKPVGLLKAGEIYNKYWSDNGSDEVVCFRAPMTCHANIRKMHTANREETDYWYRHMDACTIVNGWDTSMPALNGMDFDGDLLMITDNEVLVRKHVEQPALMCIQRKAEKIIPTEEDFVKSNIATFGNEIGQTTNWITSMFDVRAMFDKNSKEYETLSYRIQCGQLYQQNAIIDWSPYTVMYM